MVKKDPFAPIQMKTDPFAQNQMKIDPFAQNQVKVDPFAPSQVKVDPFATTRKDPFAPDQRRNPFETNRDNKEDMPFKNSGLSLGLKDSNANKPAAPVPSFNNVFKTGVPSPMGALYNSGMDSGTEAQRQFYYPSYPKGMQMPNFNPSGTAMNRYQGAFQTPTSKGVQNIRMGDMSNKGEDAGSFGGTPKEISTTKAVFNQQTKFTNQSNDPQNSARQGGRDISTPSNNYFASSPYGVGMMNYQPTALIMPQYGNTPTGGNFGQSPTAWGFNIPSPHTGIAGIQMSPFNQATAFAQPREGSVQDHQSPKFNSVSENSRMGQNIRGQEMNRQFFSTIPQNMIKPPANFAMSPANAFSFSCKSEYSPVPNMTQQYGFPYKGMPQTPQKNPNPKDQNKEVP